jgi:hypothetical protein
MIEIPVSASPAKIAQGIGAAPLQRGNREGWTLMQPNRGASNIGLGSNSP